MATRLSLFAPGPCGTEIVERCRNVTSQDISAAAELRWCTTGVPEAATCSSPSCTSCVLPAKLHVFRVEPGGFEPPTSAVQRRRHALLEFSSTSKSAVKAHIFFMTLFPSFQVIDSGCCTVAAHSATGGRTATQPPAGTSDYTRAHRHGEHPNPSPSLRRRRLFYP